MLTEEQLAENRRLCEIAEANARKVLKPGDRLRAHPCAERRGCGMKCHYCDKTRDLRPYGPRGAMVCFGCAMSTPARNEEAARNFGAQLSASGPVACIDGTHVGPYPAEHAGLKA